MTVESRERAQVRTWIWQVLTGMALLVLITIHMVAHHFVAEGGIRDFDQVLDYLANPVILAIEAAFLVVVTWHALAGVRAVIFDLGLGRRGELIVTRALVWLGVATVVYGVWLLAVVVRQA